MNPSLHGAPPDTGPVVAVTGGSIRGRLLTEGGGAVFKGIPFAQPPVGNLRWREPMPVIPWDGIRDASESGPPAEQAPFGWNDTAASLSSEDCLYLDVWAPGNAPGRLPVMVWLHGGGNVAGAGGSDPLYDGTSLTRSGVILVVVEYRVGIFGFFAHPALTAESPHHASGNYGILDQVAALQWVHDNIAGFGGDPANVTLFGQSAGGSDVLAVMATPLSRDLFHRAISESGPLFPRMAQTLAEGESAGSHTAELLGGTAVKDLQYLRSLPPKVLLKVQSEGPPFTADGWVFPVSPSEVWRKHREHAMPLIIGSNAIEFPTPGTQEQVRQAVRRFFGDLAPKALALYGLSEGGLPAAADPLYGNAADQFGSDVFRGPSIVAGEWHSSAVSPTWQYQFDRAIPPNPRVGHSGEMPYVFGNLHATGSQGGEFQDADRKLSAVMQAYWTNFARTGDPNSAGLREWVGYKVPARNYLNFTTDADVVLRENERGPFRELFFELLDKPMPDR